jgi:tRNA-binding EMAP/Myf-like protein
MEHTLEKMEHINWSDFQKIDIRVGTIIDVDDFPEARRLVRPEFSRHFSDSENTVVHTH